MNDLPAPFPPGCIVIQASSTKYGLSTYVMLFVCVRACISELSVWKETGMRCAADD